VSAWAQEAVQWIAREGAVSGVNSRSFRINFTGKGEGGGERKCGIRFCAARSTYRTAVRLASHCLIQYVVRLP
jgi:hypothetical protein